MWLYVFVFAEKERHLVVNEVLPFLGKTKNVNQSFFPSPIIRFPPELSKVVSTFNT